MSSAIVNLQKTSSSESLQGRTDSSQQRLTLQHIFNSCVLDKHQRVNAGELVRHFRFVAEQNTDLVNGHFDFAFLLNQLGGSDQQVTFEQLFNAVEKLYTQLVDQSVTTTTPISKANTYSSSSTKKRRNKENIDTQKTDESSANSFDLRRRSFDHEKCKNERNELLEINRRQAECLRMLEDEYKKLDDDHQRLQNQHEELRRKKLLLEEDLDRSSRYVTENIDFHVYKVQMENSYRILKEKNELNEREKVDLQEQIVAIDHQVRAIRDERDHYVANFIQQEHEIAQILIQRQEFEDQCHQLQQIIKQNESTNASLRMTIEALTNENEEGKLKSLNLEKMIEDLREKVRNAKTESIEARLSLSNLCEEESFLCDELEERVDVSRRITISTGQSLFAEINTMENLSDECLSQCLDSSNMENVDDMEVQILLSKSDSFNSIYLKDLFHELHSNGLNINEHLKKLLNQVRCDEDRDFLSTELQTIDKHLSIVKNLIKKLLDNKDVFEGRFRKLQTLLIATREKQQKFQNEIKEFSSTMTIESVFSTLKDFRQTIEELQYKEQLSDEKIRSLEDQLTKVQTEEKSQRLKCSFLNKQIQKLTNKSNEKQDFSETTSPTRKVRCRRSFSKLTAGICPFHSVQEVLHDDNDLFRLASNHLPCRCLNRSSSISTMSNDEIRQENIERRFISSCSVSGNGISTSDSGLNSSTGCTTSRSPTPEIDDRSTTKICQFESFSDRTLTKESFSIKSNRSINKIVPRRSERVKRVLKRLQWCAIITSCSIVLFLWSVIIRYYCLTSPNDDDCNRLSFAWWPFASCSTNGITL